MAMSKGAIEKRVSAAFKVVGTNRQIPVMKLSLIFNTGRASVMKGDDDAAVQAAMLTAIDAVAMPA